ncbi:DMT family transporter [Motilibacter aurantiacus]|uniref:DMT family transporter n=1 Tax=Motilibacter aurantiacus TaxID=2714955 RepID=UPI00140E77D5|nr:SMR family transporter [Motilibacter aurantiacus]NHC46994.1 QacE family quaternary ammonium compound efflux SMR transporter [Motilibacter aurantiacus]
MAYLFLALAILAEVAGTASLRMSVQGHKAWYAAVAAGYLAAFLLLSGALSRGIGIGVAYGVWAAAGVALTAIVSRLAFHERLNRTMTAGIGLIVLGVLLIELGAAH